jgi:hypothetical protein
MLVWYYLSFLNVFAVAIWPLFFVLSVATGVPARNF